MKLSENFYLHEFTKSQAASRLGIDNTPADHVIDNLKMLSEYVLQPVRDHFGPCVISSGYRCLELNNAIGGSSTSDHVTGCAADFEVIGVSNLAVAAWIKNNLTFKQLILEFYTPGVLHSGWVHCSYVSGKTKQEVLTATRKRGGKVVYLSGLHG